MKQKFKKLPSKYGMESLKDLQLGYSFLSAHEKSFHFIDLIGDSVLCQLVKKELSGASSLADLRNNNSRSTVPKVRDGIKISFSDNILVSGIESINSSGLVYEVAYFTENVLRIFLYGYSDDRVSYEAVNLLGDGPFESINLYRGIIKSSVKSEITEIVGDNQYTQLPIKLIKVDWSMSMSDFIALVNDIVEC